MNYFVIANEAIYLERNQSHNDIKIYFIIAL